MCGGGGDGGAAAAQEQTRMMEQQQAAHDSAVTQGKSSIDDAFKQFDDGYYSKYGQAYKDTYNPQLDEQYGIAKDKMIATLAGTDQLSGSAGANALALQSKKYNDSQVDIANHATDAQNALKANVDSTKGNLYAQNASVADPLTMAAQAQATSGSIVNPASYPTLSNVFADGLSSVATASKANSNSSQPYSFGVPQNTAPSGNGSGVFTGR